MRKFNVRWWVEDRMEKHQEAMDSCTGEGISIRYIRDRTPELGFRQTLDAFYYDPTSSQVVN